MEFAPGYDTETFAIVDAFLDTLDYPERCTTLDDVSGMGVWFNDTDWTHIDALALIWSEFPKPTGDRSVDFFAKRTCTILRSSDHQVVTYESNEIGGWYIVSQDSEHGPLLKSYIPRRLS